tara:strand:- start:831 stop:1427 length:597 start_codon:yes stop_codon:yes gene_type:complete
MSQPYILVLYFSRYGSTERLAQLIGRGAESTGKFEARIRTVPPVSPESQAVAAPVPDSGAIFCSQEDLKFCSGLAIGSPTRFGNMSASLKYFIDNTGAIWASGDLINRPFVTFTSSNSLHGGQESTLLTMAIPMLHHGMVYCGIPYSEPSLSNTKTGGSPYGATHFAGSENGTEISKDETNSCLALGKRLAFLSERLC